MYEMGGALLWPRRTEAAGCPASPALRAARQGQTPARYTGFPVHPHVPEVALRWCPFPTVKAFLRLLLVVAQGSAAIHFKFLLHPHDIHKTRPLIRISRQLSTGLYTRNPQASGGACAILSTAYFPLYLFLAYGIGVGVWGVATGGRRITAADPEPAHAL